MNNRQTGLSAAVPEPPRAVPKWFFVRRMQAMLFCGLLFVGLGLGLGGGLSLMFYLIGGRVSPMVDWDLDRDHATAPAILTHKRFIAHTEINSRHPWNVDFRFSTPDGTTVDATGYTYDQSFADKAIGESISVEYDPTDPCRARPAGGSAALMPPWVFFLILAAIGPELVLGVVLLALTWSQARRERELLTHGRGRPAEVVRVRRVGHIRFGTRNPYDVHYRFPNGHGLEVSGRDRTYHYAWAEALQPGDEIPVICNPDWPEANVLWLHGGDAGSTAQ